MKIVLFHHALGLTPGVRAFAGELGAAGYQVHTIDLYAGEVFDSLDAGVAHMESLGQQVQLARAEAAMDAVADGEDLVLIGMSMGVIPALKFGGERNDVRGVVAMYSFVSPEWIDPWPQAPIQVHLAENDPFDEGDLESARELAASGDQVELFVYPGDGHLFADPSAPGYDEMAAKLATQRVLSWLQRR